MMLFILVGLLFFLSGGFGGGFNDWGGEDRCLTRLFTDA